MTVVLKREDRTDPSASLIYDDDMAIENSQL